MSCGPAAASNARAQRTAGEPISRLYFSTVIVAEPVSGGLAESVAVTVMV